MAAEPGQTYRVTLPQIRAGEYEGLASKVSTFILSHCYIQTYFHSYLAWKTWMETRFRSGRMGTPLGRNGDGRPQVSHRFQHQRSGYQRTGSQDRSKPSGTRTWSQRSRPAQGRSGHRWLIGNAFIQIPFYIYIKPRPFMGIPLGESWIKMWRFWIRKDGRS